jgi:drug/metabolite transporter (DMT)-like permease
VVHGQRLTARNEKSNRVGRESQAAFFFQAGSTMSKPKKTIGCVLGVWSLFVTVPMYLAMFYAMLTASGAPQWAWCIYAAYVPATVVGVVLSAVFAVAVDD